MVLQYEAGAQFVINIDGIFTAADSGLFHLVSYYQSTGIYQAPVVLVPWPVGGGPTVTCRVFMLIIAQITHTMNRKLEEHLLHR